MLQLCLEPDMKTLTQLALTCPYRVKLSSMKWGWMSSLYSVGCTTLGSRNPSLQESTSICNKAFNISANFCNKCLFIIIPVICLWLGTFQRLSRSIGVKFKIKCVGLAVNIGKTKYMEIGRHRGMIANRHIKIGSNSYEKVKTFKYLGLLLTNWNSIQEE